MLLFGADEPTGTQSPKWVAHKTDGAIAPRVPRIGIVMMKRSCFCPIPLRIACMLVTKMRSAKVVIETTTRGRGSCGASATSWRVKRYCSSATSSWYMDRMHRIAKKSNNFIHTL